MRELNQTEITEVAGGIIPLGVSLSSSGLFVAAQFAPVGQPVQGILGLLGIQTNPGPANLLISLT